MMRLVTALYDTAPQAELALAHLSSEVGVEEGGVVDSSIAGRTKLARLNLSSEERARAARELEGGGILMVAQVKEEVDAGLITELLRNIPRDGLGKSEASARPVYCGSDGFRVEDPTAGRSTPPAAATTAPAASTAAQPPARAGMGRVPQFEAFRVEDPKASKTVSPSMPPQAAASAKIPEPEGFRIEDPKASAPAQPAAAPAPGVEAEEHIPIVEEELRIGKREVLRGGARVRAHVEEHPVREEVELLAEHTSIERRPSTRKLSEEELEEGGLLRERVIEVSEMREEAVVSKEAFVREEVIVKKAVERRTEVIEETVRRTEIETERLPGAESRPALSGLRSNDEPGSQRR